MKALDGPGASLTIYLFRQNISFQYSLSNGHGVSCTVYFLRHAISFQYSPAQIRFHYLNDESSDPEFLLRLPMTKSGVKALDTVENFLTSSTAPQEVTFLSILMEVGSSFPDPRSRTCADSPHYLRQEQARVGN